jgi:hypothetical protein
MTKHPPTPRLRRARRMPNVEGNPNFQMTKQSAKQVLVIRISSFALIFDDYEHEQEHEHESNRQVRLRF